MWQHFSLHLPYHHTKSTHIQTQSQFYRKLSWKKNQKSKSKSNRLFIWKEYSSPNSEWRLDGCGSRGGGGRSTMNQSPKPYHPFDGSTNHQINSHKSQPFTNKKNNFLVFSFSLTHQHGHERKSYIT